MSNREQPIIDRYYRIIVAIVLAIAFFNLFIFLGSPPVADWDEARHGVTAHEMMQSGNYIVTTYMDNPDYWNLKPPLGFWLIVVAYKLFGYSIFSLRFFSAFFAFITVLLTILLARRHYGKTASLIAGMVLSTTYGFISLHAGRTGDFDSGLTFFTVLFVFFLDRTEENRAYFYLAGLTASFAFLIKSFASAPLFFIALIYLLIKRRIANISFRDYLFFSVAWFAPIAGWAVARYAEDGHTFFDSMITYDLLKRSASAIESHAGGPAYYLITLARAFNPWSIVAGVGILILISFVVFSKYGTNKSLEPDDRSLPTGMAHFFRPDIFWIWLLVPLVLFSIAKTKLPWYITPIYPVLAIFLGRILIGVRGILKDQKGKTSSSAQIVAIVLFFCAYATAEARICKHIAGGPDSIDNAESLLYRLHEQNTDPLQTLYLTGEASQSRIFVAKVLKKLRIKPLSAEEFLSFAKAFHDNLVAVEIKTREHVSSSKKRILRDADKDDLVLMENSVDNQNFLLANYFIPVDKNAAWILARKKTSREKVIRCQP